MVVTGLFFLTYPVGIPGVRPGDYPGMRDPGVGERAGGGAGHNQIWRVYLPDDGRTAD